MIHEDARKALPGDGLLMAGYCGLAGTVLLARENEEALRKRFSDAFVDTVLNLSKTSGLSAQELQAAAGIAADCHARVYEVSHTGVFAALWEMAEREEIGFEADLRSLPIRQETIEVCEECPGSPNPYLLDAEGALLLIARDPFLLQRALGEEGIEAVVIGHVTEGCARILRNKDRVRYLERPRL